jgi:hypothetical protein
MSSSYGALCTDFYVNQKFALKMDLPSARETVLDLFDRIRKVIPTMDRFRRFEGELSLESPAMDGSYAWAALQQTAIKSGWVNPTELEDAYRLHTLLLEISPFYLSVSPLDVDYIELVYGFDLMARGNHDALVYEALLRDTPTGRLIDYPGAKAIDIQPFVGMVLNEECDLQAYFEVKTRTMTRDVRSGEYPEDPISIYLTVRKYGAVQQPQDLLDVFNEIREAGEKLVDERLVPELLQPLRSAIGLAGF